MRSKLGVFNAVLIASLALAMVACDSSSPTPTPSPSLTGGTTPGSGSSAGNVLTQHNDGYRTGQNLDETTLTRANVNPTNFGKIGALPVDGQVYAQPLVASGVTIADGSSHDILYVATENDSVYAYDADSLSTTPIWQRSLLGDSDFTCPNSTNGSVCSVLTPADTGAPNISPEIGITSTPVIDPTAGIIYVVGVVKDSTGLVYWMLHALDLGTGKEIAGSPVTIEGSLPGLGSGTDATTDEQIHFYPVRQLQRAGLVLNNGLVYVAFTSFNDQEPSHGWLFAYDSANLEPVSAFITTPDSGDGTIWQAGAAPALDENGNLFFATGNSDPGNTGDLGSSVLKLDFGAQGFDLEDYFTPYNADALNTGDVELGSGGVMLIPDQTGANPDLAVAAGKEGTVYLLDRDNLGKTTTSTTSDTQILQELPLLLTDGVEGKNYGTGAYGVPAYYQNKIFYTGVGDALRSIPLVNDQLETSGMTLSPIPITERGTSPSISADGNANGIVWYIDASSYTYTWTTTPCTASAPTACYPGTKSNGPAVLYAFSTDDISTPLYASSPAPLVGTSDIPNPPAGTTGPSYVGPASDAAGDAVKFTVPTIVDGKVFVGTQTEISVYGLRSSATAMNTQLKSDQSSERSVAAAQGNEGHGGVQHPGHPIPAPFDFWKLSPQSAKITSCGYHSQRGLSFISSDF